MPTQNKSVYKLLEDLYTDPNKTSSYGGVDRLYRAAREYGVTRREVKAYLSSDRSYVVHRPAQRKRTENRKIFVQGIDNQWQVDLLDIPFARHNDGYHFLLTVICMFSKYAWVRALRSKQGLVVAEGLEDIFKDAIDIENHRVCDTLQTDAGKEFYNQHVKDLFKRYRVRHMSVSNPDVKAMVVERFNRTLRDKIYHYMTKKNTYNYLPVLQNLMYAYNRSRHRKIKMAPVDVTLQNWKELYLAEFRPQSGISRKPVFKVGDLVVIQLSKGLFEKGASYNWTEEYYIVTKVVRGNPNYYYISDMLGEEFEGQAFYAKDLQLVRPNFDTWMRIEKVLKRRKVGSPDEEQLVKWVGWPNKFNSWVKATDMHAV